MFRFFRRIRLRLISDSRISKYLVYAIGEIILVVVGILIALQINNWNEQRKLDNFELHILHAFNAGLEKDLEDIDENIDFHQRAWNAGDSLLTILQTNAPYKSEIVSTWFADLMLATIFVHSTSAFETLKSNGINIIKNESLRNSIIEVFDSRYKTFFTKVEAQLFAEVDRGHQEILNTRFTGSHNYEIKKGEITGSYVPLDFEALKKDQEFLYYVRSLKNRHRVHIEFYYQSLKGAVVKLLDDIENEIKLIEGND